MNIERYSVTSCCGGKSIIYKIDRPITMNLINSFIEIGYKEEKHFTTAGILYVDNETFILTGSIGANRLQVKCKKTDCEQQFNNLEVILKQIR